MNSPYPVRKETVKKGRKSTKTEWVRNADKKEDFIGKFGEEKFRQAAAKDPERWGKLVEPEFPRRFRWIWLTFLDIWRTCEHDFNGNTVLTPRVLTDYCECFKASLTVQEKRLIFRMKMWAADEISSLREKDEE